MLSKQALLGLPRRIVKYQSFKSDAKFSKVLIQKHSKYLILVALMELFFLLVG